MMMRLYWIIIVQSIIINFPFSNSQNAPVFLVHPQSMAAVEGSIVMFTCIANNSKAMDYQINGTRADASSIISQGFSQGESFEELGNDVIQRNLSVSVSVMINNTMIVCEADALPGAADVLSDTAILTVQGPLPPPVNLSDSLIDSSTVNISWSPPFTLPGTDITGYNVSATASNGTTANYFTSNSYYVLSLTDITDSPCTDSINVSVSGYNGLDGEVSQLTGIHSVPPTNDSLPINAIHELDWLLLIINVSGISSAEYPSTADVFIFPGDTMVNIGLKAGTAANTLNTFINVSSSVLEYNTTYTVIMRYIHLCGVLSQNSTTTFTVSPMTATTIINNNTVQSTSTIVTNGEPTPTMSMTVTSSSMDDIVGPTNNATSTNPPSSETSYVIPVVVVVVVALISIILLFIATCICIYFSKLKRKPQQKSNEIEVQMYVKSEIPRYPSSTSSTTALKEQQKQEYNITEEETCVPYSVVNPSLTNKQLSVSEGDLPKIPDQNFNPQEEMSENTTYDTVTQLSSILQQEQGKLQPDQYATLEHSDNRPIANVPMQEVDYCAVKDHRPSRSPPTMDTPTGDIPPTIPPRTKSRNQSSDSTRFLL